ncbi:MAG: protein kinase [Acidobacteria bacterium]|nr:protein kinase [Acidobacteriota bacterium]
MTEQDREMVNDVVADALALDPDEREAFLSRSELTDEQYAEARSLLSVADGATSILDGPAIAFAKDFFAEADEDRLAGRSVGPFTIVRELGHGGMGAVYLATRKVGDKEQRVALKLLKREMNTSVFRHRFEQEREILATLSHPNISTLVDIGTTDEGTPYFAMEYVDGLPIDEFCSQNAYGRDERLALFQKVCSAVSTAHRSLIVHRDLKPSNILVTADGSPKLLDFGISKILQDGGEQESAATVTRLGAMTPSYASPEQLNGQSVTTSTDIYSLGVILFELLSGHRPFEDKEKDLNRILRAVAEDEPPAPSSKADTGEIAEKRLPFSSAADTSNEALTNANSLSAQTDSDNAIKRRPLAALRPQEIRGDLDRIVLKSLQKEPERRYLSVDAFNDDIARFRDGMPIVARPSTIIYRAGKFFRRNRAMTLVGALLVLAVLAGIIATVWQARIAQTERALAEARFNDVRALANSFLFEITPDIERLPGSTSAKAKLVTRALEYLNKLTADSGSDPELLREIAHAYEKVADVQGDPFGPNIGDVNGALESYRKALDMRLALLKQFPDDAELLSGVADNQQKIGSLESFGGDYSKAVPPLDRALELRQQVLAKDPNNFDFRRKYAESIKARGLVYFYEGDNKVAIERFTAAQEIYSELLKEQPTNDDIASEYWYLFISIGEALGWDNEFDAALASVQKGIEPLSQVVERHPADQFMQRSLHLAYTKLGTSYEDLEKFDLGVDAYQKALAIAKALSAADPTNHTAERDVAMAYKKLGQCQGGAGKLGDSHESIKNAIAVFTKLSGRDPNNAEAQYDVANTTFSLGMTYGSMKQFDDAVKAFESSLAGYKEVLAINPTYTYARRMNSHNHLELAKLLDTRPADKARAAEQYRLALDGFNALKAEGKFEKVDEPAVAELEKIVAKL